jgi:anti-sigma regulatory factor (Ser/Thr protein kinase)
MTAQAGDSVVLVDASTRPKRALERLTFVPPLQIEHLCAPPYPETVSSEPLVYLLGQTTSLRSSRNLREWLDRVQRAGGAPAAILLPRDDQEWSIAGTHPQFCGVLPYEPEIPIETMEQILCSARRFRARNWGESLVQRATVSWNFTTREAADPERVWLLLHSVLSNMSGSSSDLSCLGMAFAEALSNAVEHGNLELESTIKDGTGEGLLRFFEERERRLADPHFANRRVRVQVEVHGSSVHLRIRNEGHGFNPTHRLVGMGSDPRLLNHGFGLTMIESLVDRVAISPDGRTISLIYRIPHGRVPIGATPPPLAQGEDPYRAAA